MSSSKKQSEYKQELSELKALETRRNIEYKRGMNKIKARRKKLKNMLNEQELTA